MSYLVFFDGNKLDRKNNEVTLFSLFIQIDWIRVILYDIIIGKNFKLSYFFVECVLILFFVFSQKIKIYFNIILERHIIDPKQEELDKFAEKVSLGKLKKDTPLPQINILPLVGDYFYCFYVNNIYTFLFGSIICLSRIILK